MQLRDEFVGTLRAQRGRGERLRAQPIEQRRRGVARRRGRRRMPPAQHTRRHEHGHDAAMPRDLDLLARFDPGRLPPEPTTFTGIRP